MTSVRTNDTRPSALPAGSLISLLCVVYQSLYRAIPSNGDLMTGLPLGMEYAHPGLFSPYDLVVSSGMRGPFHLYKFLGGYLYLHNFNVDLVWHAFYLVFLFLTFLAVWFLSLELTDDVLSSALVLALIAVAHPLRGSLHASAVPQPAFVTAHAALPFALAAIVLFLRRKFFPAMALGGLVFNLHPYIGLMVSAAIAAGIVFASDDTPGRKAAVVVGGSLLALPNVVYILTNLHSNFAGVGYDYYAQFRLYALHAFIDEHWREGYGWFFLNLAGAVWFARFLDAWKRRAIMYLVACWFVLMAAYAFNSYVTKSIPVLLMFLFRATYFIKPIIFIIVVHGLRRWHRELRTEGRAGWESAGFWAATALLFVSAILPMRQAVLADVLALLTYGIIVLLIQKQTASGNSFFKGIAPIALFLLGLYVLAQFFGEEAGRTRIENGIVAMIVLLALLLLVEFRRINAGIHLASANPVAGLPLGRLVTAAAAVLVIHHLIISAKDRSIPFVPDMAAIKERIMMHRAPARSAALMQWAGTSTPQGSLFVVPPDDWEDFGSFRLVARRSLYITLVEVNQLSLDASVYLQGHQRILALGVKFPRRHVYDASAYFDLTLQDLRGLANQHADYFVIPTNRVHGSLVSLPVVYQDKEFAVIGLHDLPVQPPATKRTGATLGGFSSKTRKNI